MPKLCWRIQGRMPLTRSSAISSCKRSFCRKIQPCCVPASPVGRGKATVALAFHGGQEGGEITWETDRARFIGRSRTPVSPAAMKDSSPLSGTVGSVLDPIVSLRRTFKLAPKGMVRVDFLLGVTESREAALT